MNAHKLALSVYSKVINVSIPENFPPLRLNGILITSLERSMFTSQKTLRRNLFVFAEWIGIYSGRGTRFDSLRNNYLLMV